VGSVIVGNKSKKTVLTEGAAFHTEIASIQIAEAIKKAAGIEAWDRARLVTAVILDYKINNLRTVKKNHDLIVEILRLIINLSSLLIIRAAKPGTYVYYYAEINAAGTITNSETGPHGSKNFTTILEKKNVDDSFIEIPIKEKSNPVGVIYLKYAHQDNVFHDAVRGIVELIAKNLSNFIVTI
jgi:hypothetical protein